MTDTAKIPYPGIVFRVWYFDRKTEKTKLFLGYMYVGKLAWIQR